MTSTTNPCPCANVTQQLGPQYCPTFQNNLYAPVNGSQPV